MSEHLAFAADWLGLREPADHAARDDSLARRLADFLAPRAKLRMVDLGAGRGSNLRWLAPRLHPPQHWRLVDHDPELLRQACRASESRPTNLELVVEPMTADLADLDHAWIAGADLVTASALFDLVSGEWIRRLAAACAKTGSACLFALTVNGHWSFLNPDNTAIANEDDQWIRDLLNLHQHRDKGLGAALGPDAPPVLAGALSDQGYAVQTRPSDWLLPAGSHTMLGQGLVQGWRDAAIEQAPDQAARIDDWYGRRRHALASAAAGLRVGHVDVLALPRS